MKCSAAHHIVFVFLDGEFRQEREVVVLGFLLHHHLGSLLLIELLTQRCQGVLDAQLQSSIPSHELLNVGAVKLVAVFDVFAAVHEVEIGSCRKLLLDGVHRLVHVCHEGRRDDVVWITQAAPVRLDGETRLSPHNFRHLQIEASDD